MVKLAFVCFCILCFLPVDWPWLMLCPQCHIAVSRTICQVATLIPGALQCLSSSGRASWTLLTRFHPGVLAPKAPGLELTRDGAYSLLFRLQHAQVAYWNMRRAPAIVRIVRTYVATTVMGRNLSHHADFQPLGEGYWILEEDG
jgi:hypothetical protein